MAGFNFFKISPSKMFVDYMKFYTTDKIPSFRCFSFEENRQIPEEAISKMKSSPTFETATEVSSILSNSIYMSGENIIQDDIFLSSFMSFFDGIEKNVSDECLGSDVFLSFCSTTIMHSDAQLAYTCASDMPVLKFMAEMCVDLWAGDFVDQDARDRGIDTYNIGQDMMVIINNSKYTVVFKEAITDAYNKDADTFLIALVNVVIEAYNIAKNEREKNAYDEFVLASRREAEEEEWPSPFSSDDEEAEKDYDW